MHHDVLCMSYHELVILTREMCPTGGSELIPSLRTPEYRGHKAARREWDRENRAL